jgi:two-component system response regulator PilR (NtrC family)
MQGVMTQLAYLGCAHRRQSAYSLLVVDDEPDLLSEVSSYLRRRGLTVIEATSFAEAIRSYNDNADSIALVLTDVNLPDGNGLDLVHFVTESSRRACPCLLMTAHFETGSLAPDLRAAGVRIIDKPFGLAVLYALIIGTLATAGWTETPCAP